MGPYRNFQRCRRCEYSALHLRLALTVMVGMLANYGAPLDFNTVLQPDSVEPYFNSSIVFYKQGENGYYGNNVTVRTGYMQSLAKRSWVDYDRPLPNGPLKKIYFMAHNYTQLDNASTRIRLQIWRPVRITSEPHKITFWCVWEQLVQVRPNASVPLVYTYTVNSTWPYPSVIEGDRIGWTFEGNAGPISYQYSESHRTYFTAYPSGLWFTPRFEPIYLPSVFSIAVSVEALDKSLAWIMSTRTPDDKPAMMLVFANPDSLRYGETLSAYSSIRNTSPLNSSSNGPIDVDYRRKVIFWSDMHEQTITTLPCLLVFCNNSNASVSSNAPLSNQMTGLSVDWVSNLLYWSDAGYKRIGVMDSVTLKKWRIVVDTDLSSPQDVVVYPSQGYLFWSDNGSSPKIERLEIAQNNRKVLVASPKVQSPKTVVIDYSSLRLYWLDTAKAEVGSVKFDGSDYTPWELSLFSKISSFFIYKQYFVFADQHNPALYYYNGSQYISTSNYTLMIQGISDVVMFEPTRQPYVPSPCAFYNGGCREFCITFNVTNRTCQCSEGWHLAEDNSTCLINLSNKSPKTGGSVGAMTRITNIIFGHIMLNFLMSLLKMS